MVAFVDLIIRPPPQQTADNMGHHKCHTNRNVAPWCPKPQGHDARLRREPRKNRPWPNDSENGPVRVVAQSRFRPEQSATATKPNAPNHYKGHYTLIVSSPTLITSNLVGIHDLSVQRANAVLLQRKGDAGQNLPPVPLFENANVRQRVAYAQSFLFVIGKMKPQSSQCLSSSHIKGPRPHESHALHVKRAFINNVRHHSAGNAVTPVFGPQASFSACNADIWPSSPSTALRKLKSLSVASGTYRRPDSRTPCLCTMTLSGYSSPAPMIWCMSQLAIIRPFRM